MNLKYIKTRLALNAKVKLLEIHSCGEDDGTKYVQLQSGLKFFGPVSKRKVKKYYQMLPFSVKKLLPFSHYAIAVDIVIRYVEGGLKYGGPFKERNYIVKNGDSVAEMGAYRGYYTLYLSEKVGEKGKVVAIEPQTENFKLLLKNIKANALTNVIAVNCAVWDKKETLKFNRRSDDGQSGSASFSYDQAEIIEVQGRTLSDILTQVEMFDIDFMIIQLNGAEYRALQGLDAISPKNLSIAARYDVDDIDVANEIVTFLKANFYDVDRINEKYIYASKS